MIKMQEERDLLLGVAGDSTKRNPSPWATRRQIELPDRIQTPPQVIIWIKVLSLVV